ncbi:MAG: hypothetical protein ACOX69_07470 [Coriobacteriales bacterium]|jgi:uncharacterized protein YrrD
MLSSQEMQKYRIYVRKKKKDKLKKYGKVHAVVFHPSRPQAIGIMIKRPDLLLMKKRDDRFVSLDRLKKCEDGLEVIDEADSWDKAACKRLGVDFSKCIIWDYMPVKSKDGTDLGLIKEVFFDEDTHIISEVDISNSGADKAILGATRVPLNMLLGYKDGSIYVRNEAKEIEEAGGLAAKAGEAWAKTKHDAAKVGKRASDNAAKAADHAMNEGAVKVGESIGKARKKMNDSFDEHEAKKEAEQKSGELTGVDKAARAFGAQLGKASHMFQDFKDEYDKASHE